MPEIIDGVTYKTTPGGRPYPEAASPGKAFWQLIERAMRELDDFETYELAAMTAQIQGLANQIAAASPLRRQLVKAVAQSLPNQQVTTLTWQTDAERGDVEPAGSDTTKIQVSAAGVLTLPLPGLYRLQAQLPNPGANNAAMTIRRTRSGSTVIMAKDGGYSLPRFTVEAAFTALAGDTVDVTFWGDANTSAGSGTADNANTSNAGTRPRLSIVRLGA